MSREWKRAARERRRSTRSLGSRCRVRTELTAATSALSRAVDATVFPVSRRAAASGIAPTKNRTSTQTDNAPRRIRSAVFYQARRMEARTKCHERGGDVRSVRGNRFAQRRGLRLEMARAAMLSYATTRVEP